MRIHVPFEDVTDAGLDGFGTVLRGTRSGKRYLIRLVPAVSWRAISAERERLLNAPPHPAILPVEVGRAGEGYYLAAEFDGPSVAEAARDGAVFIPKRCVEAVRALAEASTAAKNAGIGLPGVGPLTWCNVHVDRANAPWLRVFPLWPVAITTAGWLAHGPRDLLFVERGLLRQVPGAISEVFALGVLLQVLAGGAASLPSVGEDVEDVIRDAIVEGHPIAALRFAGDTAVARLVARAIGRAEPFADAAALALAAAAAAGELDPLGRAVALLADGRSVEALAVLHKALRAGEAAPGLFLLKARVEIVTGGRDRALRTLRDGCDLLPDCGELQAELARVSDDQIEVVRALQAAMELDPLDAGIRIDFARALWTAGRSEMAVRVLESVNVLATLEPAVWLRLARFWFDVGNVNAALALAEAHCDSPQPTLRAGALEIAGQILYRQDAYVEAADLLEQAWEARAETGTSPTPEVLNLLAFARIASGDRAGAGEAAAASLDLDPDQPAMILFRSKL